MYGASARVGLGDALDDVAGGVMTPGIAYGSTSQDPLLDQLHQLALLIVAERNVYRGLLSQVSDADAPDNLLDMMQQVLGQIHQAVQQFNVVAAQRAGVQPYALSAFDTTILAVGDFLNSIPASIVQVVGVIPDTLKGVLQHLADDAADLATGVGRDLGKSLLWPAVIVGVGLLAVIELTKRAETTRTGRALARHL